MIKKVLKDEFLKNNFILFVGSMIVAVLNYLYHPILSRMMNLQDFGEVQALISIFLQMSIILGVFGNVVTNIITNHHQDHDKLKIINQLYKLAFFTITLITIIFAILSPILKSFFNFHSIYAFLILAISLPLSVNFTFRRFYLQGRKQFQDISLLGIIFAGGRLFFAVLLVWLGWSVFGAIASITLTTLISLLYAWYKTKDAFSLTLKEKIQLTPEFKKELKYGLIIFVSMSAVIFFYTFDVLLVKHYFNPQNAGLYSGIATIARIIFFVTGSIAGVLLPTIKLSNTLQENKKTLLKSLTLIIALGGTVLLTFWLFSDMVVRTLIGAKYLIVVNLLPQLSLIAFLASIINVLFIYLLALRDKKLLIPAIIAPISILIFTFLNHANMVNIIHDFILGNLIALIILLIIIRPCSFIWKKRQSQS